MNPHGFENAGGKDKPRDIRDVKLGTGMPVYHFPPQLSSHEAWSASVEYQGQQPACGAHAGSGVSGMVKNKHFTPRFTWADIKTFDGNPLEAGTDMRSIFKSLTKTGALDFELLGNNVALTPKDYATPPVTKAMRDNASLHKGDGYGFITDLTFNGIKQFIYDHGPSILLFRIGEEMWTAPSGVVSWDEKDVLPLRPVNKVVSGHFVIAHSYDDNYIYFLNSWSEGWGRKGHGYFGVNYMPYVNDVGALYPLSFKKDLSFGMSDPDVRRLQVILNERPETQVEEHGPGSPGNETQYYGVLTVAAVKKYQALHHINVTGYVGPLTRASLG